MRAMQPFDPMPTTRRSPRRSVYRRRRLRPARRSGRCSSSSTAAVVRTARSQTPTASSSALWSGSARTPRSWCSRAAASARTTTGARAATGALRARRGHPAGGQTSERRPAARRDRRHLDGRLRRVLDREAAAAALLRGRRSLRGAVAQRRRVGARRVRRRRGLRPQRPDRIARARGRSAWGGTRLWLDGGTEDPFRPGSEAFASALGITLRHWEGEHEGDYWRAHFGSYLRF